MQSHEAGSSNGRSASRSEPVGPCLELDGLRSACLRQARVIESLSETVSTLRGAAAALKAENAELRAVDERLGRHGGGGPPRGEVSAGGALEVALPIDARAPGAA